MSVTGVFNALHGETVQRAYLQSLLKSAWNSKDPMATDVAVRLDQLLKAHPKAKDFTLRIENPVLEGLYGLQNDAPIEEEEIGLGQTITPEDIYQKVTDLVLEAIEKYGDLPWRQGWKSIDTYGLSATNFISKKPYRGINSVLLNFILPALRKRNWENPYFLTFKQIQEKGGKLKKGSKGYLVVYFSVLHKYKGKKITEREYWKKRKECDSAPNQGTEEWFEKCRDLERIPFLKYYKVFNGDDIEGIDFKLQKVEPKNDAQKIETAEAIIKAYSKGPQIGHAGDRAFYSPAQDRIQMPPQAAFDKPQEYYSTLFHECIHSTGHHTRLDRNMTGKFGTKDYAFEELIAEMGANYLNAEAGILYYTMKNSASYLKGWSKKLKDEMSKDNRFFFRACSSAQEAADFILDRNKDGVPAYLKKMTRKVKEEQLELALSGPKSNLVQKAIDSTKQVKESISLVKELTGELKDLFVSADKADKIERPDTFRLPAKIGEFMQDLQRYKLAILLKGDPHAGKSEFLKQLIDGFLEMNWTCALFDLEQGGMASKDTEASIRRNIKKKNLSRLFVTGEAPNGFETVKEAAKAFDVVAIDSWQKLDIPNQRFDELRNEYPNTIFIVIFQQNGEGGTRGGVTADYDAPVAIKVHRVDADFKNNYAEMVKNRGNKVGIQYGLH